MNCLTDSIIYVTVAATANLCYLVRIVPVKKYCGYWRQIGKNSVLLYNSQEVSFIFSDTVGVLSVFISLCIYLLLF